MARRRYISTDAGRDKALRDITRLDPMAAGFYFLSIPAAGDDCAFPTNDPDELLWEVWPSMARDVEAERVEQWIAWFIEYGLWEHAPDGRLRFPPIAFYRYQSYIREGRRGSAPSAEDDPNDERTAAQPPIDKEDTAQKRAKQRKTAQNPASFSSSSSSSVPSSSPTASAPAEPSPAGAPQDVIWDVLAELFGVPGTDTERKARNAAVQQFRNGAKGSGITEDVMVGRIRRAQSNWSTVMKDAVPTPHALAKHFGMLLRGKAAPSIRPAGTAPPERRELSDDEYERSRQAAQAARAQIRGGPPTSLRDSLRPIAGGHPA